MKIAMMGRISIVGLAMIGSLLLKGAAGAEDVIIPYRCEAFGRSLNLTPSAPHSYEISGRHEQDIVTACAPNDPNRCRTWRLHRFALDCGGTIVPWIEVVAAANRLTNGPARVRDGQLFVRMDPWWVRDGQPSSSERPRLREFDDNDPRPGNPGGPSPMSRAPSVEMPPGFAPVVGMTATFPAGPPPVAELGRGGGTSGQSAPPAGDRWNYGSPPPGSVDAAPPKPAATAPPAAASLPPLPGKTVTRDAGHTFAPKPADAKPADTKPSELTENKVPEVKAPESKTTNTAPADDEAPGDRAPGGKAAANPLVAAASPEKKEPEVTAATSPPAPTPTADPTINTIAPTILNRPGAETKSITSATSSSGDKAGTEAVAANGSIMPATLEPALGEPASSHRPVLLAAGALALLGTALAFYFMRRGGAAQAGARHRDLSSVTLDATQSRALVPAQSQAPSSRTRQPGSEPSAPPQIDPAMPPPLSPSLAHALMTKAPAGEKFVAGPVVEPEWLPATREDALHVLGAGPDASEAVLKKIVDGLRMSWHPDHAKTADDHRLRSERMTQINVAWDILHGRQAATG